RRVRAALPLALWPALPAREAGPLAVGDATLPPPRHRDPDAGFGQRARIPRGAASAPAGRAGVGLRQSDLPPPVDRAGAARVPQRAFGAPAAQSRSDADLLGAQAR